MSHHCIDWIPSHIASQASIFWTLDFGLPESNKPKFWVEHGIPDNHVISKQQFHDDVTYLCNNDWTYEQLLMCGMNAHHVGGIYLDRTIPSRRNPTLFVYAPQHALMERHDMPVEWNHPPKTAKELRRLADEYECEEFVTSIVDDTQRDLYCDLNPLMSNRYKANGVPHFNKCKYLYENAKVIYADIMSTFDVAGEAHGIKILGRDMQRNPRPYENINVLIDGGSCTRILEVIESEIKRHS